MSDYDFTYLSLGAGVQSSALLLMSNLGLEFNGYKIPRCDIAIFADTASEPPWVYEHLEKLKEISDIEIKTVCDVDLTQETLHGRPGYKYFCTLPVWSPRLDGPGNRLLRRQCTRLAKIEPLEREVRRQLGYKKGQRIKESVRSLIGISTEEAMRMKPSRTRWVTNEWPLVEARLKRHDCLRIIKEHSWPTPKRSSCWFCPFHSDREWVELKKTDLWPDIVAFDKAIRNKSQRGESEPIFLHRSCKPIGEVDFTHGGQTEFDFMGDECEGVCGV